MTKRLASAPNDTKAPIALSDECHAFNKLKVSQSDVLNDGYIQSVVCYIIYTYFLPSVSGFPVSLQSVTHYRPSVS